MATFENHVDYFTLTQQIPCHLQKARRKSQQSKRNI